MRRRGAKHAADIAFGETLRARRWRLSNGLTVLTLPDPSVPVVAYHTWFRVGSRDDPPGKTGLAHFFEHLMFNETENLPHGEFDRRMEEAGADTNAGTWIDWTYYHQTLPAEELPLAIELEAERMERLVLRAPQVRSEREVVASERRSDVDDDVYGFADERLHLLAFGREHPHGWPTLGWMKDIEGFRVPDCRRFYRTWYAPNNATIVIAGKVNERDALARIEAAYGSMRSSRLPARPSVPSRRTRRERVEELRWPTLTEKLALGWPAPAYSTFEHAVGEVVHDLWLGGRSARLWRRLVEDLEVVASMRGSVGGLEHEGLFHLWVSMREGQPGEAALRVIDEEVERLATEPVPEAELDKVKARAELHSLADIETADGKAYALGFGETLCRDPAHQLVRLDELRRVSAEDVRRFAQRRLRSDRRARVHVRVGER